ncbi:hypothetical protein EY643_17890 [Halioglobus maricola]|uniref:DUF748 domain-containing protein n=1 Tax=Halioglobus maricola TaxID=2601894 RepID=A0A5P9NPK8_9GAMM|nr:hypothetical protein [Halioglobus maricola]QFU77385.1 hypothetical protein EY643_17890 [Halioglobus maricola]
MTFERQYYLVLLRVLKWIVGIELAYLVLVNALLWLPLTQNVVNMIRPEKFHVSWEQAWSWYPFRVHAEGISANGQSRSQQWQVEVASASASVSLLPMIFKRVTISNAQATDVDYRQRPRLKPDRDYSGKLEYFPEIAGRELVPVDDSPRKKKRAWKVFVTDASVSGEHSYWIHNISGGGKGGAEGDFQIESRGGPMQLAVREIDLNLAPGYVNTEVEVFHGGTIAGSLGFSPFVPRENKGLRMLKFLQLAAQLDVEVASLAFLNLFTPNLGELEIGGAGRVAGQVNYRDGYVLQGTNILASAPSLEVSVRGMDVSGEGEVSITTPEQRDTPLTLFIAYDEVRVQRQQDEAPFLQGDVLELEYGGSNLVYVDADFEAIMYGEQHQQRRKDNTLRVLIEDATMVDMGVINDYLPPTTALAFTSGTAQLQAAVHAVAEDIRGEIVLQGEDIGMQADGQDIRGDIDVQLHLTGGSPRDMRLELDGSTLTLDQVRVAGEAGSFDGDYWSTLLTLREAEIVADAPVILDAEVAVQVSDTRPVVAAMKNIGGAPKWLAGLVNMKDIAGDASVHVANNRLTVPAAQVASDKAEVAAKVVFYPGGRDGVIYLRYKKLDSVVEMAGEESEFKLRKAREKFDAYELEQINDGSSQ